MYDKQKKQRSKDLASATVAAEFGSDKAQVS